MCENFVEICNINYVGLEVSTKKSKSHLRPRLSTFWKCGNFLKCWCSEWDQYKVVENSRDFWDSQDSLLKTIIKSRSWQFFFVLTFCWQSRPIFYLEKYWSPEQVSTQLSNPPCLQICVEYSTIHKCIFACNLYESTHRSLM